MDFFDVIKIIEENKGGNLKGVKSTSWNSRENKKYYKHKHHWEENSPAFKVGRERLVSAVCNRITKDGKFIDRKTVRNYIYKISNLKFSDRPEWFKQITKQAIDKGYNPENSYDQKNITTKKDKGYKGRAFYFSSMINAFTNHFKKELGGK